MSEEKTLNNGVDRVLNRIGAIPVPAIPPKKYRFVNVPPGERVAYVVRDKHFLAAITHWDKDRGCSRLCTADKDLYGCWFDHSLHDGHYQAYALVQDPKAGHKLGVLHLTHRAVVQYPEIVSDKCDLNGSRIVVAREGKTERSPLYIVELVPGFTSPRHVAGWSLYDWLRDKLGVKTE